MNLGKIFHRMSFLRLILYIRGWLTVSALDALWVALLCIHEVQKVDSDLGFHTNVPYSVKHRTLKVVFSYFMFC